ncbi:MAG: hypothetical protein MZV70_19245 [Desulfobacterales bacterium]|nr:hypothetical protein [Desulfobacterales bacterium]
MMELESDCAEERWGRSGARLRFGRRLRAHHRHHRRRPRADPRHEPA